MRTTDATCPAERNSETCNVGVGELRACGAYFVPSLWGIYACFLKHALTIEKHRNAEVLWQTIKLATHLRSRQRNKPVICWNSVFLDQVIKLNKVSSRRIFRHTKTNNAYNVGRIAF